MAFHCYHNIDHAACVAWLGPAFPAVSRFRAQVPQAILVHCHMRRLNLVLVDCVRNVKSVADFFCYCARHVQVFFSSSFAAEGYECSGFVVSPTIRLLKELRGHSQAVWKTVRAASGFGSSGMTRVRPKNMSINHLRTPTCQNFRWL